MKLKDLVMLLEEVAEIERKIRSCTEDVRHEGNDDTVMRKLENLADAEAELETLLETEITL